MLCADCREGYSRNADYECNKCPKPIPNIIRLSVIFVLAILVIVFLIRSTLNGAKDKKNVTSIYTKILMNHLQLILLTSSFEFKWPDFVKEFFSFSKPISEVSQ